MRWQDDDAYTGWLLENKYARMENDKISPYLTGGVVLYMHEAWTAGRQEAVQPKPLICQCKTCRNIRNRKEDDGALLTG